MSEIVNGFLLREGRVLMAKRSAGRANYPGTWSVPGGHVEPGETLEAALQRELVEEINVLVLKATALGVHDHGGLRFHMFAVTDWSGVPELRGDEHSEIRWCRIRGALTLSPLALPSYASVLQSLEAQTA